MTNLSTHAIEVSWFYTLVQSESIIRDTWLSLSHVFEVWREEIFGCHDYRSLFKLRPIKAKRGATGGDPWNQVNMGISVSLDRLDVGRGKEIPKTPNPWLNRPAERLGLSLAAVSCEKTGVSDVPASGKVPRFQRAR